MSDPIPGRIDSGIAGAEDSVADGIALRVVTNLPVLDLIAACSGELRSHPVSKQDLPEIRKFGALFESSGTRWRLTPLGLQVQSHLRSAKG